MIKGIDGLVIVSLFQLFMLQIAIFCALLLNSLPSSSWTCCGVSSLARHVVP